MIIIKAYRVIDGEIATPKEIERFKNNHKFGFDIFDEDNWLKYLLTNHTDIKDKYNFPLAFNVMIFGTDSHIESMNPPVRCWYINKKGNRLLKPSINLFPSVNSDSTKRPIAEWGVLERYMQ